MSNGYDSLSFQTYEKSCKESNIYTLCTSGNLCTQTTSPGRINRLPVLAYPKKSTSTSVSTDLDGSS